MFNFTDNEYTFKLGSDGIVRNIRTGAEVPCIDFSHYKFEPLSEGSFALIRKEA